VAAVHVLVFEGFADWEAAFAMAELRRSGGLEVVTVGLDRTTVRSMGGLPVEPDRGLEEIEFQTMKLLILPGGDAWEDRAMRLRLRSPLLELNRSGVPIAAICGATLAVAEAGLLDDRSHTSNELAYLEQLVPGYRGSSRYVNVLAVRDRGVVTASGLGAVEFAREIFEELSVFSPPDRGLWYQLFKHGRMPAATA
jgi:putative intracellular protease/amidase